jgi:hypothetical protein
MYEADGSAVVTGPVYPYDRTIDLTLAILLNRALAVAHPLVSLSENEIH